MAKKYPYRAVASFLFYGSRRSAEFNCMSKESAIKHIRAKWHGALDIYVRLYSNYEQAEQLTLF